MNGYIVYPKGVSEFEINTSSVTVLRCLEVDIIGACLFIEPKTQVLCYGFPWSLCSKYCELKIAGSRCHRGERQSIDFLSLQRDGVVIK